APGMIHAGDVTERAFTSRGWTWGGSWDTPIDYQHFEKP
ncbi:M15 family metallopeptidase, partial [Amycolatopsis sp. H6(2020)]|nr:M15 family metallopeptidase [Amycolatopsis sp. H6(2020)]MBE8524914.1 M15 family metallopeptidase [Amycolatopsis sp. H6(2020)]